MGNLRVQKERADTMKKYFIGLDLSLTGTGFCLVREDWSVPRFETLKNKLRGVERLIWITESIRERVEGYSPEDTEIVIEDYSFGSFDRGQREKAELHGNVKTMLFKLGFDVIWIAPTSLKKFATGKGNAKKDVIIKTVFQNWGYDLTDNNQADAAVLAHIGRCRSNAGKYFAYQVQSAATGKGEA